MSERHEMKYLPINDLVPSSWNSQEQDQATFNRLVDEVATVGHIEPVKVVPLQNGKYRIIGGQHGWEASKVNGLPEVPCIILEGPQWVDEDLQKMVTVRLNVLRGHQNPEKFLALYNEMAEKYGADAVQGLMGYTDRDAFQKLVGGVRKGLKKSLPKNLQQEFDEKAKSAKTAEELGNIVQTLLAKYGETMNLSFLVFSQGKQQHIYVAMDAATRKAMNRVVSYCRESGTNINEFMAPILAELGKRAITEHRRAAVAGAVLPSSEHVEPEQASGDESGDEPGDEQAEAEGPGFEDQGVEEFQGDAEEAAAPDPEPDPAPATNGKRKGRRAKASGQPLW